MKKSTLLTLGVLIITPPILVQATSFGDKMDDKIPAISFPSQGIELTAPPLSGSMNIPEKAEGIIGHVMYYGKRLGHNEKIDIFLDSQTITKEDTCFLSVVVFNSKDEEEYRLTTTIVEFRGSTHYEINLDPPKRENETYREVRIAATFYSNKLQRDQFMSFFIEYPKETKNYVFENNMEYQSTYPIATKYLLNGEEINYYEKFDFKGICDLNFEKPIFDVKKLKFTYDYENCEIEIPNYDECYLLIDDIYNTSDFEEKNEMKKIPLHLKNENGTIQFELVDEYFYDSSDGMIYLENRTGRRQVKNLILPTSYKDSSEAVYYELHFENFSSNGSHVVFKSYASFDIKWFGSCGDSFFCVESEEEMLEDVYYSGGVII